MQLGFSMGWVGNFTSVPSRTPMSPRLIIVVVANPYIFYFASFSTMLICRH
jgi:hypothetical protein